MAWYQRNYSNLINNNLFKIIINDYKTIHKILKDNNIFFLILLIFFLPFFFFIYNIYLVLIFSFILFYFIKIILYFLESLLFINEFYEKKIFYIFPENEINSSFLCILNMFLETAKKQAFIYIYAFFKFNFLFNFKNFIIIFISFFLRILFFLIFGYNVKFIKLSSVFLNFFFKNFNKKKKLKFILELTFADFFSLYDDYLNNFVKTRKIIINNKKITFNPKTYHEIIKDLLNSKFKLSDKDLIKIAECLNIIKSNSYIRYLALRTEVFNNYPNSFREDETGIFYVGEKIPHSSLIIPYNKSNSLMVRETTKQNVLLTTSFNKDENKFMETGFKSQGSINTSIQAYKTPVIESKNSEMYELNNKKLLNNIRQGLVNKDDYLVQLINSIFKPTYIFENGNLFKDDNYKNLHHKITTEFSLNNNNELMSSLNDLVEIWQNNYDNFSNVPNNEMMESVIKFVVIGTDYIVDPKLIQLLYDLN